MHRTRADCRRSICGSRSLLSAIANSSIAEGLSLFWREPRANASFAGTRTLRRSPLPSQQQVERSGPAVSWLGGRDRENPPAQPGLFEPARHRAFQHAGPVRTETAPGDDQHAASADLVRSHDEADEFAMGFGLGHAMEIETRLDRMEAALQPLGIGPIDAGESIERLLNLARRGTGLGPGGCALQRRRGP